MKRVGRARFPITTIHSSFRQKAISGRIIKTLINPQRHNQLNEDPTNLLLALRPNPQPPRQLRRVYLLQKQLLPTGIEISPGRRNVIALTDTAPGLSKSYTCQTHLETHAFINNYLRSTNALRQFRGSLTWSEPVVRSAVRIKTS